MLFSYVDVFSMSRSIIVQLILSFYIYDHSPPPPRRTRSFQLDKQLFMYRLRKLPCLIGEGVLILIRQEAWSDDMPSELKVKEMSVTT